MRKTLLIMPALIVLSLAVVRIVSTSNDRVEVTVRHDIRDNATSHEIRARLIEAFGPDALNIVVGYENDVAVLSGDVQERPTQKLAAEVAQSVQGIIVVHNFLDLKRHGTDSAHETSSLASMDTTLRERVSSRLASDIGEIAPDISVEACDGVVLLRGTTPDSWHHDAAIRIAENLTDVTRVIDLIQIAWTGSMPGIPGAAASAATYPVATGGFSRLAPGEK